MEMIDLNIPSKFAHSIFLDRDGKEIDLRKGYIDIFYTLVYLSRRKLFELNNDCLLNDTIELKSGKKKRGKKLNDNIDYSETLSFEFCEISSLIFEAKQQSKDKKEGKHNSRYNEIRKFTNEFKDVYVKTNIFDKDKKEGSEIIKVFDKLEVNSSDNLCVDVVFAEEYILPYMVTEKYFKKVRLEILYRLNSIYSKKMYLFLRDYSGCEKKTNKYNISMFLGMAYSKRKIESYLYEINECTDITVELGKPKYGKKSEIKFTIENQDYFVNEEEKYQYEYNKGLEEFIRVECRKIADIKIFSDQIIEDYDSYVEGIFKNKINSEHEFSRYKFMYEMKENILYWKEKLIEKLDEQEKFPILYFYYEDENNNYVQFFIDDNYRMINLFLGNEITSNAEDTRTYWDSVEKYLNYKFHYDRARRENCTMSYFY